MRTPYAIFSKIDFGNGFDKDGASISTRFN